MKTSHKIASVALAMSALSTMAHAQASVTTSSTGTVTVVQPISMTAGTTLKFGRVTKPTAAATVVIPASATPTAGYSGTFAAGAQTISAASFTLIGDGGQNFTLTPDAAFVMTGGGTSIAVTTTTSLASGSFGGTAGALSTLAFYVGGTASLAIGQAPAAYTGTFNISVNYN